MVLFVGMLLVVVFVALFLIILSHLCHLFYRMSWMQISVTIMTTEEEEEEKEEEGKRHGRRKKKKRRRKMRMTTVHDERLEIMMSDYDKRSI